VHSLNSPFFNLLQSVKALQPTRAGSSLFAFALNFNTQKSTQHAEGETGE
jgi:hypothetical protein